MSIEVLANTEISELNYQIFGKGTLVTSQNLKSSKSKRHIITFIPKATTMIPKAKIVVFYFASNGEIISDNVEVEFGNELMNFVSEIKIKKN